MIRKKNLYKFWVLACTILLCTCTTQKDKNPTDVGFDRTAMLTHIADQIILPGYANFKVKLDVMTVESDSFSVHTSTASLIKFRKAWEEAYIEWQKIELFDVGPAEIYTLRNYVNIYPASASAIETNVNTEVANFDTPDSYPQQGFPALDYLINGLGTDEEIVVRYTTATDATKRKNYLKKVIAQLNNRFNKIYNEWTINNYRATFVSKTAMDIHSSTSLLVNGYVLNYERYIRSGKFGIPSGAMLDEGTTAPEKIEAFYKKDLSLILAKTAHEASVDLFHGKSRITSTEGPSLKTYLTALNAKDKTTGAVLVDEIDKQFSEIEKKLDLLQPNLNEEVKNNNQAMINTFEEMQKLVRMIKVDMTSALSVTITYTDNDGD